MKKTVFKHTPLYRFLQLCNKENSKSKFILDCGAGGNTPPLSLFKSYGYDTTGVDLDKMQVLKAQEYGDKNGQQLNINQGDMTKLQFDDNTFDFVYSYNSIFHMKKKDIKVAIDEMKRVLKPNGLMFVNFLSIDDFRCGEGPDLGDNQYEQMDDEPVIHSYFEYDEGDRLLDDLDFVLKERRVIERIYEERRIKQGFIDYIMRKK